MLTSSSTSCSFGPGNATGAQDSHARGHRPNWFNNQPWKPFDKKKEREIKKKPSCIFIPEVATIQFAC